MVAKKNEILVQCIWLSFPARKMKYISSDKPPCPRPPSRCMPLEARQVRLVQSEASFPLFLPSFFLSFLPQFAFPPPPRPSTASPSSSPLPSLLSSHTPPPRPQCCGSRQFRASGWALSSRFDSLSKWIHLPLLSPLLFLSDPPSLSSPLRLSRLFFKIGPSPPSSPYLYLIPPSSHCHPLLAPCNPLLALPSITRSSCPLSSPCKCLKP